MLNKYTLILIALLAIDALYFARLSEVSRQDFCAGVEPRVSRKHVRVIALDGFPKSAFPVSSAKSTPCRLNIAGAPAPFSSTPEDARSLLDKPGLKWCSRIRAFNSKIKSSTAITALSIYVRSAWQTMRTRQSALLRPAMSSLRSVRATSSSASTKISLHENRTSG